MEMSREPEHIFEEPVLLSGHDDGSIHVWNLESHYDDAADDGHVRDDDCNGYGHGYGYGDDEERAEVFVQRGVFRLSLREVLKGHQHRVSVIRTTPHKLHTMWSADIVVIGHIRYCCRNRHHQYHHHHPSPCYDYL